eukprot:CAMPEP_0205828536 /NCGR_PEP_ID=MMETSP0206-20130828/35473_1 /ASSEMBLY_ACC=CAM_ASM_000279 /TAXON_ID=36767 /ORGANISM="Euplotes focardii, Strain TN1" /LENGTH=102 /DNA_ID=CAMNT_0053130479 /DNA_START=54 /DNA_END=359 /DNA_ORIENTATION=+
MEQIAQNCRAGQFQYYDYGAEGNLEQYGSETAPEVPIQNINTPVAIFNSRFDGYGTQEAGDWLEEQLGENVIFRQVYEYSHYSFYIAQDMSYMDDLANLLET